MATSVGDFKLASVAAGFTLGFGLLTVWEAIKQTREVKSPLRSVYIYMIWGEIAANLLIGILAWLFLDETIKPGVPLFFGVLFCWVFEIQLLMQIIINRLAIVVDNRQLIRNIKWGTAGIITLVNIAVFIIWIPAHLSPPPVPVFVTINTYWDRTSKIIICLVDAGLNYYFLRTVKQRLVKYHGLTKYAPLVSFNAKLMVISIAMDVMLIGLMSLPNQVVYVQFHPVAYMVKLNIEMSMANLIKKLAKDSVDDRDKRNTFNRYPNNNMNDTYTMRDHPQPTKLSSSNNNNNNNNPLTNILKSGNHTIAIAKSPSSASSSSSSSSDATVTNAQMNKAFEGGRIHTTTEVLVKVENAPSSEMMMDDGDSSSASDIGVGSNYYDDGSFGRRQSRRHRGGNGGGGLGLGLGLGLGVGKKGVGAMRRGSGGGGSSSTGTVAGAGSGAGTVKAKAVSEDEVPLSPQEGVGKRL